MKTLILVLIIGIPFVLMIGMSLTVLGEDSIIPSWIKNTAYFWVDGTVSDVEFLNSIKYLVENEILIIEREKPIDDKGDFYITYLDNPNTPFENSSKDWLIATQYLESQRDFLNELFSLPYDVEIMVMECDESNMFYDLELKLIILCYEFIDDVYVDFVTYHENNPDIYATDESIGIVTLDVIDFVFFHEVGHVFVDVYNLPITGLEENAVDQFATMSMFFYEDDSNTEIIVGQEILYNVGTWFFIQTQYEHEQVYWDTHNLDIQRFYNVSCYAYGHTPEYNQDLIDEGWLPEERALSCEDEYSLLVNSWNELLEPFYKS